MQMKELPGSENWQKKQAVCKLVYKEKNSLFVRHNLTKGVFII